MFDIDDIAISDIIVLYWTILGPIYMSYMETCQFILSLIAFACQVHHS